MTALETRILDESKTLSPNEKLTVARELLSQVGIGKDVLQAVYEQLQLQVAIKASDDLRSGADKGHSYESVMQEIKTVVGA